MPIGALITAGEAGDVVADGVRALNLAGSMTTLTTIGASYNLSGQVNTTLNVATGCHLPAIPPP